MANAPTRSARLINFHEDRTKLAHELVMSLYMAVQQGIFKKYFLGAQRLNDCNSIKYLLFLKLYEMLTTIIFFIAVCQIC